MIRMARVDEAEVVAHVIRTAFAAITPPLDPAPSALKETGESVRRQIEAGGGAVWDEHGIQGCVLWREEGSSLYMGRLAVHPKCQGRGIAAALMRAVQEEARRRDLKRVTLAVRLALRDNRRLFAAAGFHETELHTHEGYAAPTFVDAEKWLP